MKLSHYSKKTFAALLNDRNTVSKVFPDIIVEAEYRLMKNQKVNYVGVKDTDVIPYDLVNKIKEYGFLHHTNDVSSDNGRAIDINRLNPITGRLMTGSSSGTALNVFYDINDIGIATDGGGSVLAPAIALNLIGFISPLICQKEMQRHQRVSTDDITFSPSIGYISKEIANIEKLISLTINEDKAAKLNILVAKPPKDLFQDVYINMKNLGKSISLSFDNYKREILIQDLREVNFEENILITYEGPVDYYQYGDTVMGHYCQESKSLQQMGHKYYLTVVNMLNLTSIIIPTTKHGCGILLTCKSDSAHIQQMLILAKTLIQKRSKLEEKYFSIY